MKKLVIIGHSKTKLSYLPSVFCAIFYGLLAVSFPFLQSCYEKGYLRYETGYMYAFIGITAGLYLLFGILLAYLANKPKGSVKTIILELIVIDLPAFLMAVSIFTMAFLPFILPMFIIENVDKFTVIGSIILGCELFRAIKKQLKY
jgi:hypothetical protein